MRNLDNFRQGVESPKSWNSMGYICLKTTFLHLKHYLQICLRLLSTDLWFGKWHEEYGKFFPEHSKSIGKILKILMRSFNLNFKKYEFKIHRGVSVMKMKNYAKCEEELTCYFKVDLRNLTNFDPSTWRSQKFSF